MRKYRFLLPLLLLVFIAAASRPKLSIRFYAEENAVNGEPFTMSANIPGTPNSVTLGKIAQISEHDIEAIYPFPAADGSIGCALKLDTHGKIALDSLSTDNRGKLLVGFINGRPVTAMLIDRRVTDGIINIVSGLTSQEIAIMKKYFPVLGENKNKKKSKPAETNTIPVGD